MHTHETQSRRESCVLSFNHLILIIIIIIIIIIVLNFICLFEVTIVKSHYVHVKAIHNWLLEIEYSKIKIS